MHRSGFDQLSRRPEPPVLVAAIVGVAGLVLLFHGLGDGVPLVYWGTEEERAARQAGRTWILAASAIIVAAGAFLAVRRTPIHGIAAAAVAPVTAVLAFVLPGTGWAWPGFLILAPVALGAWIAAVFAPVRPLPPEPSGTAGGRP